MKVNDVEIKVGASLDKELVLSVIQQVNNDSKVNEGLWWRVYRDEKKKLKKKIRIRKYLIELRILKNNSVVLIYI